LDRSVKIARSSLPSGVANLLAPSGANNMQRQLLQRLCVDIGQTGGVDWSDRSPGDSDDRPPTSPGQDPVRETHVGLLKGRQGHLERLQMSRRRRKDNK
jgi:hypothetical protein